MTTELHCQWCSDTGQRPDKGEGMFCGDCSLGRDLAHDHMMTFGQAWTFSSAGASPAPPIVVTPVSPAAIGISKTLEALWGRGVQCTEDDRALHRAIAAMQKPGRANEL